MPLPSLVRQAYDEHNALIDAHDAYTTGRLARLWFNVMEKELEEPFWDVANEAMERKKAGKGVSGRQIQQMKRYHSLLAGVDQQLRRFGSDAEFELEDFRWAMAQAGVSHAETILRLTSKEYNLGLGFDVLNEKAVESIVALTGKGKPLGDLLHEAYGYMASAITQELVQGVAVGRNPREIARRMKEFGLSSGFSHILLVSRDQALRASREGTLRQYRESGHVQGYKRLAAKNERTCPACLALDGKIWPIDKDLAVHPQDRCTIVPIIKGGPSWDWENGEQWFKRQPRDVQERILGKGKLQAFENSEFEFGQLATVKNHRIWGPSNQITSLKDLKAGKGGFDPGFNPNKQGSRAGVSGPEMRKRLQREVEREKELERQSSAISEEISVLNQQAQELWEEYQVTKDPKIKEKRAKLLDKASDLFSRGVELDEQLWDLRQNRSQRLRDLFYADSPAEIDLTVHKRGIPRDWSTIWEQGAEEFKKLIGRGKLDGKPVAIRTAGRKRRSFYRYGQNTVYMSKQGRGIKTVVHELGHWLEDSRPDVKRKAVDFWNRRTRGESFVHMGPNYDPEETTRVDKFSNKYMGKVYNWKYRGGQYPIGYDGDVDPRDVDATEIVSMGIEKIWADPYEFAQTDPEYFDLIWEIIR